VQPSYWHPLPPHGTVVQAWAKKIVSFKKKLGETDQLKVKNKSDAKNIFDHRQIFLSLLLTQFFA